MLSRHRIVSSHREHIVIVSSSMCTVPFYTKGRVVSYHHRVLRDVRCKISLRFLICTREGQRRYLQACQLSSVFRDQSVQVFPCFYQILSVPHCWYEAFKSPKEVHNTGFNVFHKTPSPHLRLFALTSFASLQFLCLRSPIFALTPFG